MKLAGGAYGVYAHAIPAPLWSGNIEEYYIFSDLERAQDFIRTHRFVEGER